MAEIGSRDLEYGTALPPSLGTQTASDVRRNRLIASVALAIVSRITALGMQLLVPPIVLAVLGTAHYAAYLSLQASLGWFGIAGLGLTIALPRFIAAAAVRHDTGEERDLILTSTALIAVAAVIVVGVMLVAGLVFSPRRLLDLPSGFGDGAMMPAFISATLFAGARFAAGLVPSVRSGYQELYRIYVMSAIANLVIIVLIVNVFPAHASIAMLFAYMYGPIVALFLLDYALLFYRRRYLLAARWNLGRTTRALLPTSLNAVAKQIAFFLMTSGAVLSVAHWAGVQNIDAFGSLMALIVMGMSAFSMVFQPMLAAMANAHSHGDKRWFSRAYYGGIALILAITGLVVLIAAAFGPALMLLWLHTDLAIGRTLCIAMALYFMCCALSDFNFLVLASVGELTRLGKIYVLEGITALALGAAGAHYFGIEGMAAGMAVGTACFSLLYLPWRTWRILSRDGWLR